MQATADDGLVARHGGLTERSPAVVDCLLPAHAALVPDQRDVSVAPAGRGLGIRARHRGRTWRDDHGNGWVGLALGHGAVDRLAIVSAVRDHGAEGSGDLLQQRTDLGGVTLVVARQLAGEDLAAVGINSQMEFAPLSPATLAMLLDEPLARAVDLQPGRVDHHVHRPARLSPRQGRGECQTRAAARERGMIGHADGQAEQAHDGPQQALRLPPWPAESQAQQVPGLDRHIRIVARSPALSGARRLPGRERLGRHPDGEAPALL